MHPYQWQSLLIPSVAAKGFMEVLKNYLDSLCSNLHCRIINNVQSHEDKVSLLLKESFIVSFPSRDRAFMKLFVTTHMFLCTYRSCSVYLSGGLRLLLKVGNIYITRLSEISVLSNLKLYWWSFG